MKQYSLFFVLFSLIFIPQSFGSQPFGTYLGHFGSVQIYSNGNNSYYSSEGNSINGRQTGVKWQCVEFTNRAYISLYGIEPSWGNANEYFNNALPQVQQIYNGGYEKPQVGDIICSNEGNGHVGIVSFVTPTYILMTSQNFNNETTDANTRISLTYSNGHYTLAPMSSGANGSIYLPIVGWLRKRGSCTFPTSIQFSNITANTINVNFSNQSDASNYLIAYKPNYSNYFYEVPVYSNSAYLTGLAPSTTYDLKIKTTCTYGESDYSSISSFTTNGNNFYNSTVQTPGKPYYLNLNCGHLTFSWNNVNANYYRLYCWDGKAWYQFGTTTLTFCNVYASTGVLYFCVRAVFYNSESSLSPWTQVNIPSCKQTVSQITKEEWNLAQIHSLTSPDPNEFQLRVYPNPVGTVLMPNILSDCKLLIYNITGDIVQIVDAHKDLEIDVSNLTTGFYIIKDVNSGTHCNFIKK